MKFKHTLHKELWQFLADNPEVWKDAWPKWIYNGGEEDSTSFCFACDYDEEFTDEDLQGCENCPLIWPINSVKKHNCIEGGLYDKWVKLEDVPEHSAERKILAEKIRDLPVREGVECI
jgi:hypothetical protein